MSFVADGVPESVDPMTSDKETPAGFSLKRWSRRKLAASREVRGDVPAPPATPAETPPAPPPAADAKPPALPSVESLTTESDFTPFMRADVDAGLQRKALRKLFSDPRFNVMDGLDVYIDDYSKPDPIAPDVVAQLAQARYLFDPPATRVDENGVVVDVPAEPQASEETPPGEPAAPGEPRAAESSVTVPAASGTPVEMADPVPSASAEPASDDPAGR